MQITLSYDKEATGRLTRFVGQLQGLKTTPESKDEAPRSRAATEDEVKAWFAQLAERHVVNFERAEAGDQIVDAPLAVA